MGIVLTVASLFGPWWVVTTMNGGTVWQYGLFGFTQADGPSTVYHNYTTQLVNMGSLFIEAAALGIGGLALAVAAAALAIPSGPRLGLQRLGTGCSALASFLVLAAAVGIMLYLPSAANQDLSPIGKFAGFWGSADWFSLPPLPNHVTWGAGWAWYAVVVAGILFLADALLLFRTRRQSGEQATQSTVHKP